MKPEQVTPWDPNDRSDPDHAESVQAELEMLSHHRALLQLYHCESLLLKALGGLAHAGPEYLELSEAVAELGRFLGPNP